MKFRVDAHLSRGLCAMLAQHGHDAKHTLVEVDRTSVTSIA